MKILKPVALNSGGALVGMLLIVGMTLGTALDVSAMGHGAAKDKMSKMAKDKMGSMSGEVNLAKMKVGDGLPKALTDKAGDAKKGAKLAVHRKKGNCLACHSLPVKKHADHGNIGPDLAGIGSRLTAAEIRLRIVDPKAVNPDSIMPSFYRTTGFHRVQKKWKGKTVIGAQDVEDIIAYLLTLKE
jgi:L-cysteine S-thiosulfotransferase